MPEGVDRLKRCEGYADRLGKSMTSTICSGPRWCWLRKTGRSCALDSTGIACVERMLSIHMFVIPKRGRRAPRERDKTVIRRTGSGHAQLLRLAYWHGAKSAPIDQQAAISCASTEKARDEKTRRPTDLQGAARRHLCLPGGGPEVPARHERFSTSRETRA